MTPRDFCGALKTCGMNTRNNSNGGGGGGASSGVCDVAGSYAVTAQAGAAYPATPPPTNKRKTPLSGGSTESGTPNSGCSVNREASPEERCRITPHQSCNRCESPLDKVSTINRRSGRRQSFGSCSSGICGGGGVFFPGPKDCEFCLRDIQANTVCLSVNRGANGELLS